VSPWRLAELIVLLLLVLYVVDAVRRPGRPSRPLAREDGEPFHAFVRGRAPEAGPGSNRPGSETGSHVQRGDDGAGEEAVASARPLEMARVLDDAFALGCRRIA
jgi:hypothetical protein